MMTTTTTTTTMGDGDDDDDDDDVRVGQDNSSRQAAAAGHIASDGTEFVNARRWRQPVSDETGQIGNEGTTSLSL